MYFITVFCVVRGQSWIHCIFFSGQTYRIWTNILDKTVFCEVIILLLVLDDEFTELPLVPFDTGEDAFKVDIVGVSQVTEVDY